MSDAFTSGAQSPRSPEALAALGKRAWPLLPVQPEDRRHLLRDEAALLIDELLVKVARGSGAIAVAMGECLDCLCTGDGPIRLGYTNLGDYAREELSLAPRTAKEWMKLARDLRTRPVLRAAVEVEKARRWDRIVIELEPEEREVLDRALEVAGKRTRRSGSGWRPSPRSTWGVIRIRVLRPRPPVPPGRPRDWRRRSRSPISASGSSGSTSAGGISTRRTRCRRRRRGWTTGTARTGSTSASSSSPRCAGLG